MTASRDDCQLRTLPHEKLVHEVRASTDCTYWTPAGLLPSANARVVIFGDRDEESGIE
jgi:hypothetical protein